MADALFFGPPARTRARAANRLVTKKQDRIGARFTGGHARIRAFDGARSGESGRSGFHVRPLPWGAVAWLLTEPVTGTWSGIGESGL